MNTFWLKIAALAVGVVVLIIVASNFFSKEVDEALEPKTGFYDQAEKDKQNFLAEPHEVKQPAEQQPTVEANKPPEDSNFTRPVKVVSPEEMAAMEEAQKIPDVLYFKPLGEIDKIEAERLFNVAVPGYSIGRLPMMGYKGLSVDPCRQIIKRWPDSFYAFQAKRLLANLPERYQKRYNVTAEEKDLTRFFKPREGTVAMQFKETN